MKLRSICVFILIICLSFSLIPVTVSAASPTATLTVDGDLIGTYTSVQEAIDAVALETGTNFVIEVAAGTVSDPINILQLPNKNVVLKPQPGASVTFTNTITIDGNGNLNNPETLLIQGFTFDFTSGSPENCIYFNLIPPRVGFSYPHNVTINGCTFKGVYDTTVAVQSIPGGSRNLAIMNCTATDMHSLAQFKAVSGYALIQNCVLENCAGGVNYYGTGNLVVDSCKFNVTGYAVRSGQSSGTISDSGSVTVNNSILNSNSAEDGTIVLRGDSTRYINILHSNITNNNASGAAIENLNMASQDQYRINIVESNRTGGILNINLSTINTIDDPNVPNGPVNISGNGSNGTNIIILLLQILLIMVLVLVIVILACVIRCIIRFLGAFWRKRRSKREVKDKS